jgi:hypothetical protein
VIVRKAMSLYIDAVELVLSLSSLAYRTRYMDQHINNLLAMANERLERRRIAYLRTFIDLPFTNQDLYNEKAK